MGEREDRGAVPALISALKDEEPEVRAIAAWALGEIKDSRALSPLIDSMRSCRAAIHASGLYQYSAHAR